MSGYTDFAQAAIQSAIKRAQALGAPATMYFGLLKCSHGLLARSTAYSLNNTVVVSVGGVLTLYKVTTAGTTAGSAPSYPGVRAEAITDGTAVLTEQSNALDAADTGAVIEPSAGSYARVAVVAGTGAFGAPGVDGATSNSAAITFPTPTADYQGAAERIWGIGVWSASSAGNFWEWGPLSALQQVLNGQAAPSVAISAFTSRLGA
jgi:hypothetical protein